MCLNPTLCIGALRTGDVMQRLSPPVHPYKVAARQISCMPRSTQAHKRLVRGKLSFSCQSRKWSCYCLGNRTIPLLACSLPWEANIIFFFFFLKKKLLWAYAPSLLHHLYFITLSPSVHKEKKASWSQCEPPLLTATCSSAH